MIEAEGAREERRELVVGLLDELSNQYLPRSVWLTEGSRKKVENFLRMSEELCSEFSAEIEARGYPRVRHSMERRVSKKLRPLKTEAESGLETELGEPLRRGSSRVHRRRMPAAVSGSGSRSHSPSSAVPPRMQSPERGTMYVTPSGFSSSSTKRFMPGLRTRTTWPRIGSMEASSTRSLAPSPTQLTTTRASTSSSEERVRLRTLPPAALKRSIRYLR